VLFLWALALEESGGCGAGWALERWGGVAALTEPVVLSVVPATRFVDVLAAPAQAAKLGSSDDGWQRSGRLAVMAPCALPQLRDISPVHSDTQRIRVGAVTLETAPTRTTG